eukprot:3665756-Prymnesium_polylepis.1
MPGRQRVAWGAGGKAAAGSTPCVESAEAGGLPVVDYPSLEMARNSGDSNTGYWSLARELHQKPET